MLEFRRGLAGWMIVVWTIAAVAVVLGPPKEPGLWSSPGMKWLTVGILVFLACNALTRCIKLTDQIEKIKERQRMQDALLAQQYAEAMRERKQIDRRHKAPFN